LAGLAGQAEPVGAAVTAVGPSTQVVVAPVALAAMVVGVVPVGEAREAAVS